jgi:hypothetical protein
MTPERKKELRGQIHSHPYSVVYELLFEIDSLEAANAELRKQVEKLEANQRLPYDD